MLDFHIQPNSRRCCVTGRELKPGEKFYTVLVDENGQFFRQEYSAEAWQQPPEGAFSYWVGTVPVAETSNKPAIDDEMLLECFERLEGKTEPGRMNFRYILALFLMRRKQLKFEEVFFKDGNEILRLKAVRSKEMHEVVNPNLSEEEIAEVQEEVFKVLGW